MTWKRGLGIALPFTMFVALPLVMLAYSVGPDPGYAGAPGEDPSGCASGGCHTGARNPTMGSGVQLLFANGATYTPGVTQRLTVRITNPQSATNGFQLTVRVAADTSQQAGDLVSIDTTTQVICEDRRARPCRAAAPLQYAEHTAPGSKRSQWNIDWTPPAVNVGPIAFYLAGNAANGNSATSGDLIYLNTATAMPSVIPPAPQIRATQPVLQAFLGGPRISPATWIEIYGANLAPATRDWSGLLAGGDTIAPISINGVTVTVDGKPAFLYYTSPSQINAQVPDDIGQGPVTVEVANAGGRSSAIVQAAAVSPALLTKPEFRVGGVQYVAALFPDGRTYAGRVGLIDGYNFRPAKPGDVLTIYAVGCGESTPFTFAGTAAGGRRNIPNVQVRFGQTVATASAAMSAGSIGLCQFTVTVPNVASGDHDLEATVAGVPTGQGLKISVQQ